MEIIFDRNLKKLRKDKNLTQEELAGFLGISFQSISKWERNEGYPDITMLPILANYFDVTVDELIGSDIITKEEKIKSYLDTYWHFNVSGPYEKAKETAEKAYAEYPYEWSIIDIYCLSLTKGYTEDPGDKLPKLRAICKMIIDECKDANIRMHAVYSMLFAESDDNVEEWFLQVPGTYDFTEWERREDRYFERGQMEKFTEQKQNNMYQLYRYLIDKMMRGLSSAEEFVYAYQHRIAVRNALFGENATYARDSYAFDCMQLAAALFRCSRVDEGFKELEKSVDCWEKWFAIPENTVLKYEGCLFDTKSRIKKNTWNAEKVLEKFIELSKHEWLADVRDDEKYKNIINRIKSYCE